MSFSFLYELKFFKKDTQIQIDHLFMRNMNQEVVTHNQSIYDEVCAKPRKKNLQKQYILLIRYKALVMLLILEQKQISTTLKKKENPQTKQKNAAYPDHNSG